MTTASHTQIRTFALSLVIAVASLAAVGCKTRQETPASALRAEPLAPKRVLSSQDVATWPEVVTGGAAPIFRMPGIVIGITPDKSRTVNEVAGDALKTRAAAALLSNLREGQPSFFILAAVNPAKLGAFVRPMVSRGLRNQLSGEVEAYYDGEFAPWRNQEILESTMLAANDSDMTAHASLGLVVPAAPGATAPLSVAVVSKKGEVYGPFAITGAAATTARELDAVFAALDRVLAD